MKLIALATSAIALIPALRAENLPSGTWVRRANKDGIQSTMLIENAGTGRKLTFRTQVQGGKTVVMVVTTQLDGKDAPVLVDGNVSGQTMAIRVVDDRHYVNVIKMGGTTVTTQKSELSADGKTIRTEGTPPSPGAPNTLEFWDKK